MAEATPATSADVAAQGDSVPTAAQIPLQDFKLPEFPPEASHLKALTLTSDIKPTDYSSLLENPIAQTPIIPASLPANIESLTLELFSLGYRYPFLAELGRAIPKLKSLTLYSQLIDGVEEGSRRDSGEFLNDALVGRKANGGGLRELHLLDVFCRKGFMAGLGAILEDIPEEKSVLRFLEITYTYRGHSDSEFLNRVLGDELPAMLVPSLIAASISLSSPPDMSEQEKNEEVPVDPAHVDENGDPIPGRKPEGIIPWSQASPGTEMLVWKLTGKEKEEEKEKEKEKEESDAKEEEEDAEDELPVPGSGPGPRSLKLLDSTFYALDLEQLKDILSAQKELSILSASVIVSPTEEWKAEMLETLHAAKNLEILELVGVPNEEFDKEVSFHPATRVTPMYKIKAYVLTKIRQNPQHPLS